MSEYDSEDVDSSEGSDDSDETTGSEEMNESLDIQQADFMFQREIRLAMQNKGQSIDYNKMMLAIERDSKKLGHDSSDDNTTEDNSVEDEYNDTEYQSNNDDKQYYENSEEEEEPFIDEDDFDINDGESEEEFEEMTDKKDVADKDRRTDISDWIKNMFPDDLKKALDEEFKKPKCKGRTTSIDADNVNDFAFYVVKRKKSIDDPLKGTKDVTPYEYSGDRHKFKCHSYISIVEDDTVYSPFKRNISAPNWYKYLYIF